MKPIPIARYLDQIERNGVRHSASSSEAAPILRAVAGAATPASRPKPVFVKSKSDPAELRAPDRNERSALQSLAYAAQKEQFRPIGPMQRDIDAMIADAFERGLHAGRAAALEESRQRGAEELTARQGQAIMERVEFQLNEYAKFGAAISGSFVEIEERLGEAVARILTPFVHEQLIAQIVDELQATIRRLVSGRAPGVIKIRGPERLLARLREALEPLAVEFEYVLEDKIDVTVETDDTMIETQLSRWNEILSAAKG